MGGSVDLRKGAFAVHPVHGVGRVVERSKGDGRNVVTLEFGHGLLLSLPLEQAQQVLRPLPTESELDAVAEILRGPTTSTAPWLHRRQDAPKRLTSGSVLELAELIRDTARSTSAKRRKHMGRSSEENMFRRAREALAVEIAHTRGHDTEKAREWIDLQLGRT